MLINVNKVKIFVTVPFANVDLLRNAVCEAGAGIIGNYSLCTFLSNGVGTFKPNENAKPYIGKSNSTEFVKEEKLEFVCDIKDVKNVLLAIRKIHPYEEPAIDIVPLLDENFFS